MSSKFIKIDENSFINTECIEAIEEIDVEVILYTSSSKFKSNLKINDVFNVLDLNNKSIDLTKQFVSL